MKDFGATEVVAITNDAVVIEDGVGTRAECGDEFGKNDAVFVSGGEGFDAFADATAAG